MDAQEYNKLTDFQKLERILRSNFPFNISNWIDIYQEDSTITSLTAKTEKKIMTFTMPVMNFGVIKKFGFGVLIGNPDEINVYLKVDGKVYPANFGNDKVSFLSLDLSEAELQNIHIDIQSNSAIEVFVVSQTSINENFTIWTRLTGWYYG